MSASATRGGRKKPQDKNIMAPYYIYRAAIKIAVWAPSHKLSGYIFATKACIDNRKKVLNSNVSYTWHHNTVNFGLLAAEICWRVCGSPANFNAFRVLTALLHDTLVVGVSQTLRR